jgi:archaemetzincin
MAFKPPANKKILSAIGSTAQLPAAFQRALTPDDDFGPIPVPKPGDWLAEHHERGQTFAEFVRSGGKRPDHVRNVIYLQPIGQFRQDRSPSLDLLREYASAYFLLEVRILPARDISKLNITIRSNPYTQQRQILTADILGILLGKFPADAFCVLAVTMEDLYPDPRWNFVFGQASQHNRVGVFSFARYNPAFYGEPRGSRYQQLLLRRSARVLVHETAHIFSLAHCIYFKCVMNGSNHLQECDARPLTLCPVCLHKLQNSIGFDVGARYRRLIEFYRNVGFEYEADWVAGRLTKIIGFTHGRD